MENNFYVYIYLDPRKPGKYKYGEYEFEYEPFYVGKGKGRRYKRTDNSCGRNDYFKKIVNKIKNLKFEPIVKLKEKLTENRSFRIESNLINLIGRGDLDKGPLVNFTDGGEGSSGYKHSEKTLKKLKKEYSDIEIEFKKRKYILLTKENEYKNCYTKLKYICTNNHKHSINWTNFKQGENCPYCAKNKIDFLDIEKEFENRDYKLLTKENEYINSKQKLEYIHNKCGSKHCISWNHFRQKQGCPYCSRKKLNFSNIEFEFEKRKCLLLTKKDEYRNNKQKLDFMCLKGHIHSVSWSDFQRGRGYRRCNRNKEENN